MELPSFSKWSQLSLLLSSFIPFLMFSTSSVSITHWDVLHFRLPGIYSGKWSHPLWYKVGIQGPHNRINRTTMTMVNTVFHQSPFTYDRTEVQKGRLSSDIAFTWSFMSSRVTDILPDKSGIYTQHSALIIAQVPPWAAVSMSKAILFWITAFLICICSVFSAWIALRLSFRALWVKLVRASTLIILSIVPNEGTNIAPK